MDCKSTKNDGNNTAFSRQNDKNLAQGRQTASRHRHRNKTRRSACHSAAAYRQYSKCITPAGQNAAHPQAPGTTRRLPAAHIIQTSQEGMQAECAPPVSQVIDNQHSYKTCRFSLQNGTFRAVKRHVSGCQTAHIANQAHKSWHCVRVQHSKRHAIISATAWQSQRTESTWPQRKPNRTAPPTTPGNAAKRMSRKRSQPGKDFNHTTIGQTGKQPTATKMEKTGRHLRS